MTALCNCPVCSSTRSGRELSERFASNLLLGDRPPEHFIQEALVILVRRYPSPERQLEAALRDALRWGWLACYEIQKRAKP